MSRWGTPLRIARRTVRRNLGRSLLIAVLVGLPVAGATFVDVLIRSFDNNERTAYQQMGPADAELVVTRLTSLRHYSPAPYGTYFEEPAARGASASRRDPSLVDMHTVLPAGSTWIEAPTQYEARLSIGPDRIARPTMVVADLDSPLAAHQARLTSGRLPTTPDEVVVTKPLADRLGLLDGDDVVDGATVTLADGGPTAQVTGLVQAPFCLDCEEVVVTPDSTFGATVKPGRDFLGTPGSSYLVDLPDGVDAADLWKGLARDDGIALTPRDVYLHPERYEEPGDGPSVSASELKAAAVALLVTGLGLLEVVLLAGTAFAVGARRQVHDLGVISASGATARQIRRVVLAQGLVLGLLGSALGILFGAAVAVGGRSFWESLDDGVLLGWKFGVWEIAVAALVGAASGVLAAVVPAIGAGRMTATDALSGRFRVSKASKHWIPAAGVLLVAVGVATGIVGDRMMAADFASYVRQLRRASELGTYVSAPSPTMPVALVLAGAVFAVVGLVMLAPVMISLVGQLARRLPLSPRLAFRDAARHRHRTGPATSAIAVAVSGSVVLAFVLAGRAEADRIAYTAYLPPNVMSVSADGQRDAAHDQVAKAADSAAAILPEASVVWPTRVTRGDGSRHGDNEELWAQPGSCARGCTSLAVGVADPATMELALGRSPTEAELAALADGKAVSLSPLLVRDDGQVKVGYGPARSKLPAVVAPTDVTYPDVPGVFVTQSVVDAHHWGTTSRTALLPFAGSATPAQIDDAMTAIEDHGAYYGLDTGPSNPSRALLVIAAIAAGFVTLVGVAISVALSAAEGRADLATLAAVGAPPRRRRSLAAAQALLVGGLGCGLGLLLGVFVSYTLRATIGAPSFVVPWPNLLTVGIVVPVVAVLIAAIFTPSRLPLTIRRGY